MDEVPGQKPVSLETQYQIAAARRQGYDTLMWQTPVLSLTGLAFLFLIALGGGTKPVARITAATLALLTSVVSAQLMAKHRHFEVQWAKWLNAFETEHSLLPINAIPKAPDNPLTRLSSYCIWLVLYLFYGVAALLIIVMALTCPQSL